ncbi:MAG: MarR family transcriptional regulator [Hoeflea sp.]|uniref:MarR family winged helix-turn-helix transcriptional regulator n=1 Tax=Hoeflea sp. TaxID=1940281 RepID=UPI001D82C26C|nr:MarR family transcriptional regulator [Hoeflea sp.]MBU4530542.1 MarR family transcriptional regulator [Alphaproteobacteria bacterium]MBU4545329.1 MarR family transcriptional regulator [Alphaproteobacteria bacterium]MBU4548978.1 MarR family transcriptional regulator [Alphaproteobacteria bacterium]MBV1722133.1 MarR family transcriptional regulator [Hoeflea sp.]MBV1761483.1 MarR family transcriptional regulator [Hoeflea sp.]
MNKNQALPWENPRFRNWIAVGRACQVMGLTLARALQPLDIKPPHLDILVNLFRTPGISQQDLADKLLVGRSNLSMLLPQLEKRGLIVRSGDAKDRRILRLELTPEGISLTEEAIIIQSALIDRTMKTASAEECDLVGEVMLRIIRELTGASDDEPAEAAENERKRG